MANAVPQAIGVLAQDRARQTVTLSGDDGELRAATGQLHSAPLTVVATAPSGAAGILNLLGDAWILIGPLGLGLGLTAVVLFQERRARRATRNWADTERRFHSAVEAARCGVWEWDLDRDEVILSDVMAGMLGFSRGGSVSTDEVIERLHPRHQEAARHALRQAAAYGVLEIDVRVEAPDQPPLWMELRGQALRSRRKDGHDHLMGVALDITESRRAKAQAQAAENRLRDAIESVSDAFVLFDRFGRLILWNRAFQDAFGYQDSHLKRGAQKDELNRIAALAIRKEQPSADGRPGIREIMAGEMFGPLGDERYKGYATDILNSGQHLLALINDILDMAKIESGKMTLHYEAVDLGEVCQDAIRLMRGRAQECGLTLTLEAPETPEIEADYRALKQVLLNLISNAVKFTPEGGSITVSANQTGDLIRVAVRDTGIGIAAQDLARLAQPFEQVEGQHSKTTQGTGLGLALTKSLIEIHHGEMAMESEPGHGTTVSFTLPIKRPTELGEAQAA